MQLVATPLRAEEPLRLAIAYAQPPYQPTDARVYTDEEPDNDLAKALSALLQAPVTVNADRDASPLQRLTRGQADSAIVHLREGEPAPEGFIALFSRYSTGFTVAMRSDTTIRSWEDLKGKSLCLSEGSPALLRYAQTLGATLQVSRVPAQALVGVRTGTCDASLHPAAPLSTLLRQPKWSKFSASLDEKSPTRLALLVPVEKPVLAERLRNALSQLDSEEQWLARNKRWAANVAFEVYLDQEAPDCH